MDPSDDRNFQILAKIHDGKPVTDEEADWAVKAGYARYGEDGDIDLSQAGREAYDRKQVG